MAPNFARGKVYAVRNTVNAKVYVGSTVRTLAQRMSQHRGSARDADPLPLYVAIREIGVEKFYIELITDCPCDRRETLHREEGRHIRELNTIAPNGYNSNVSGRAAAEWRVDNAETIRTKKKLYHEANCEAIRAKVRAWAMQHPEKVVEQGRRDRAKHADTLPASRHEFYLANKEAINATQRAYYLANKAKVKARVKAYSLANAEAIKAKDRARYAATKAKKIAELAA